tara:strand:+ start:1895 stop:3568 length:1674 start_codon:yes stop_codon:yes gene_type:complete
MTAQRTHRADVVVLGAGLAGTVTALCLVRQGLSVMVIDQGTHPRFALGESTTTPSSLWLRLLAARFDVPELLHIASHEALRAHVSCTSGVKNNFGFLYHRDGAEQPTRSWQAVIATASLAESEGISHPRGGEMHYFRQDVDAYLWQRALQAGVVGHAATVVDHVEFAADEVRVDTRTGDSFHAAFLVDASGYRSPVAKHLGLRDAEPRWRTNSRTMFTHMVDVKPYDECWRGAASISPWHQGTLHHFFDGGWVWVIPFGNHPESQNRLCSVGLSLDNHRGLRTAATAEQEWRDVLTRFPAIAAQLGGAKPVRPWIATDRVQYSSSRCVGDRFWMAPHAAGAVDALYSMGNINTFQCIAAAVPAILASFRHREFNAVRFEGVQRLTDNLLRFQDCIAYGNYAALQAPELLEPWLALWALTDTARIRELLIPLVRFARTGDRDGLGFYERDPSQVFTGIGHCTGVESTEALLDRLDGWCDVMQELQRGTATVAATLARLRQEVQNVDPYRVNLGLMGDALGRLPWTYASLASNGLRAYASTFLTAEELNSIGVEGQEQR